MQKIVRDGTPANLNDEDVELLEQHIHALGETLRRSSTAGCTAGCYGSKKCKCYGSEECTRIANANSGNVLVSPREEATKGETHVITTRNELNQVSGIWVPSIRGSVRQMEQILKPSAPKRKSPKTQSARTTKRFKMAVLPCVPAQEPCKPGEASSAPELSLHEAVPGYTVEDLLGNDVLGLLNDSACALFDLDDKELGE